jgi:hypothetical protein
MLKPWFLALLLNADLLIMIIQMSGLGEALKLSRSIVQIVMHLAI